MSMDKFPIICEVALVLTDGKRFARLTGPVCYGHVPEKEWMLKTIAAAIAEEARRG